MMNKNNGYFDPESIEEQIELSMHKSEKESTESQLLHTLHYITKYDVTEEDRVTLQRARERILKRRSSHEWVEIIPLLERERLSGDGHHSETERQRKKPFFRLVNAIATALVIGLAISSWMAVTNLANQPGDMSPFPQGAQQKHVYVLDQDVLSKLDGPTGKAIWRHQLPTTQSAQGNFFDFFEVNGIVYTESLYEIYAFKASTGEELWHYKTDVNKFPKIPDPSNQFSPTDFNQLGSTRDDKRLYLQYPTGIIALDLKNGRELWQQYSSEIWEDPATRSWLLGAENDQLYIKLGTQLYALDSASGNIRWSSSRLSEPADHTFSGFQMMEGVIYYTVNNILYALREQDGRELWQYNGGKQHAIYLYPSPRQGLVHLTVADQEGNIQELRAIDAKSGSPQWIANPNFKFSPISLLNNPTANGLLLAYGIDNTGKSTNTRIYALDTKNGQIRWRGEICACESTWTRITDDTLYLADGKTLIVYELSTGKVRHQQQFEWPGMQEENNGIAYLQAPHRFYAVRIADNTLLWEYKIVQYGESVYGTPIFLIAP